MIKTKLKIEDIHNAKTDRKCFNKVYKCIFYDGNVNKVSSWLKKFISYNELPDVESDLKIILWLSIINYKFVKIDFEKYVWTKFQHFVFNYLFYKKFIKKHSPSIKIIDVISQTDEYDYNDHKLMSDSFNYDDIDYDVDRLFGMLSDTQSFICKCKYYSNWTDSETMRFLNIDNKVYNNELNKIKKIIGNYFIGDV